MSQSPSEMTLDILILGFVSCGFIGVVGCASVMLKICCEKYVLQNVTYLPEESIPIDHFQDFETRYAKATVSILQDQYKDQLQHQELVEVRICDTSDEEITKTNIIAQEIGIALPV